MGRVLLFLIFLFPTIYCQNDTNTTTTPSTNEDLDAIFGLDFLGWGFDATYRDPFFALKPPLFDFSYERDPIRTYRYPTSTTTYKVPDQVFVRTVGKTTTDSYLFLNSVEKTKTLDLRLNIKASTTQLEGSFTFTLNWIDTTTTDKRIVMNMAETSLFQLYLAQRNLSEEFLTEIDNLPATYAMDPTQYDLFLARFGTHFVDSVIIGGSVQQETIVNTENSTEALMFKAVLQGKFQSATGTDKVEGELDVDYKQTEKRVTQETTSSSEIYGGDPEFTDFVLTAGDPDAAKLLFESWKSTLITNPVTIRYRLVDIWQVLTDAQQRKELCKASATLLGFLPNENPNYCNKAGQVLSGTIQSGI